eukprot:2713922-Lingulodinium_polyedra.AAC.1
MASSSLSGTPFSSDFALADVGFPVVLVTARGQVLEGGRRLTRLLNHSCATLPLHGLQSVR